MPQHHPYVPDECLSHGEDRPDQDNELFDNPSRAYSDGGEVVQGFDRYRT
jgi:hypothetical protein